MRMSEEITASDATSELETLKNDLDVREVAEHTTKIDEATKQQLRELGYA